MPGLDLSVTITGEEDALRPFQKMEDGARNPRPVLTKVRDMVREAQVERFSQGRGMKKLAPVTRERKEREGLDPRPLRRTGLLINSVTKLGAPEQVNRIDHDEMVFGTRVYYARFHDKGEGVPKRRVMNLTNRQREPIAGTILDFLLGHGDV